jgi:hypothetical protein
MGNLVINVRGTNGSGKTTAVKRILDTYGAQAILDEKGKVRGYVCKSVVVPVMNPEDKIMQPKDLYILGAYETPTGGCDGINTQDKICDLIREWAPLGNVLYEGLLISGLFSRYNSLADELNEHHFILGFLDTPLQRCIDQTLSRRAAKGNIKPFDPYKTLAPKFEAIISSRKKFELAGTDKCECCKIKPCQSKTKDVRTIPHKQAVSTVLGWIRDEAETYQAEETTEAQVMDSRSLPQIGGRALIAQGATCNEYAASFIPRLGTYFSCVLEKGHDGEEHRAGGECFTHGKYVMEHSEETPKCPKCEMENLPRYGLIHGNADSLSMMKSEFHQWEPDFSEGEPDPKEPTCGVCGRADDLYHFKRKNP